jgi:hypothetical protein
MAKEKKIMFLCDQKRECHGSLGCGLSCRHTADQNHAINGGLKDGKFPGGRFLRDSANFDVWWEIEE